MTLARLAQKFIFASGILLALASQQALAITINLNFVGGLTASQQSIFTQAENFWESVLIGYQPDIFIPAVTINAEGAVIDGVGGTLGSAGPTAGTDQGGYTLATEGDMTFDSADLNSLELSGSLQDVILHEMAHVLGFGTLWDFGLNDVYDTGTGEYTGANALATYQTEFNQPGATFIPVELGGGVGTMDGHWNENDGGSGLTGIVDGDGNDMRDELMTGWLNSPTFVSNTTRMSFMDIGYDVALVPVPAALWLFISGAGVLFGFSARKKTKTSQLPG